MGTVEESPRSPEAKLGMRVEDLWDVQEAELSPTEKLNACFENIPVSAFPQAPASEVVEIKSDTSLAEAVRILAQHNVLSAPVVNVDAPDDASWIDRYIGMVEFAGIAVWIIYQSEPASPRSPSSVTAITAAANRMGSGLELNVDSAVTTAGSFFEDLTSSDLYKSVQVQFRSPSSVTAITAAANRMGSGLELNVDSAVTTAGSFFEDLTSSDLYKSVQVRDIAGTFRWAPFLALQNSNSFLTMLLLLSKYKMKSVPVIDIGEGSINNIITQSAVIHMLAECAGLQWFENWGNKTLSETGLPVMKPNHIIKVYEDEPVLQAFKLMRKYKVGGVPIIESGSSKAVGNISLRDVQFLLTAPEIYHDYRSITARNFLAAVKKHRQQHKELFPVANELVTCTKSRTMKEVILLLDSRKIHRIYVVDDEGNLEGVLTLRDIISKLVHEPPGYFGDFFDGFLPLPLNSSV